MCAQKSIFWTTGSGGDGAAAYTQAEIIRWQRQQWIGDNTIEGVHKRYLQELKVTAPGSASPYNVATGAAMVYGFPYWNTSNYTASIPTPATGTRYDRIVLQADWSNTAVRIARLGGVAGGTQASLTQTDGVKWEIQLARLAISTGGVVTVTDKRNYLNPNIIANVGFEGRQGGSSTPWYQAGTTDYTPSSTIIQAGMVSIATSGSAATATGTIAFPQRFPAAPLVVVGRGVTTKEPVMVWLSSATAGGAYIRARTTDGSKEIWSVQGIWLAVGPE